MGDYQTITQQITQILAEKTSITPEHLRPDTELQAIGLDSFARIQLVLAMEEQFGFELSDSEAADLSTVDDLVNIILLKQTPTSNPV